MRLVIARKLNNVSRTSFILLIACMLSTDSIIRYVVQIIAKIPIIDMFSSAFEPALFVVLVLLCLKYILKNVQIPDVFFVFAFYLILLTSMLFNQDSSKYIISYLPDIALKFIPCFFLGIALKMDDNIKKWLYYLSVLAIWVAWLYLAYYYSNGRSFETDSMYESYAIVIHVLIVLWCAMDEAKVVSIISSVAGILYIFSMGTRGPVVIILAFVVIYMLYKSQRSMKLKIAIAILAAVFAYLYLFTDALTNVVVWLREIVNSMGYSTRIFDSYLLGEAHESYNSLIERDAINSKLLAALSERPIFGYGLYGEYPFINWSAHNMYLQVCFNFGYPIGILLIVRFVTLAIKALYRNNEKISVGFILIWLCYIIPQGFFGGNIMSYYMFFTIGLLINQIRKNKREIYETRISCEQK